MLDSQPRLAPTLASRITNLTGSVARDILSRTQDRHIVSFAGGLPDPELWDDLVLPPAERNAYQYGPSEGEQPLRELFARELDDSGLHVPFTQTLVTNGSQQAIDLACKLLVDPGAPVLVEAPCYVAALQNFQLFQSQLVTMPLSADGLDLDQFERLISQHKPVMVYLNPTFQNPSGHCYTIEQRQAIAAILDGHRSVLVEDDPYRQLYFSGEPPPPPIASFLTRASWLYLSSASKTLLPGIRIGCLAASADLFPHVLKLKQAADLHTNRPAQMIALSLMADQLAFERRLATVRRHYQAKRDAMQETLKRSFAQLAEWTPPQGGMFFWLRLFRNVDLRAALEDALGQGVAFMPGTAFFPKGASHPSAIRLNFTNPRRGDISKALPIIAATLRNEQRSYYPARSQS